MGIFVHEIHEDNSISFPLETIRYNPKDFFPLREESFLGTVIETPNNPVKVLNTYFGEEDWLEYCMPLILDHRQGGSTNFPQKKFKLKEGMDFLKKE